MIKKRSRVFLQMFPNSRTTTWSGLIIYNWRLKTEERIHFPPYPISYMLNPTAPPAQRTPNPEWKIINNARKAVGHAFHKKFRPSRYCIEKFARIYPNAIIY